jgi:hypothetical protein
MIIFFFIQFCVGHKMKFEKKNPILAPDTRIVEWNVSICFKAQNDFFIFFVLEYSMSRVAQFFQNPPSTDSQSDDECGLQPRMECFSNVKVRPIFFFTRCFFVVFSLVRYIGNSIRWIYL